MFKVGEAYADRITVVSRSPKTITCERNAFDNEHPPSVQRYRVYTCEDGSEYTIIDRMISKRYERWGLWVFADPDRPPVRLRL